MYSKELEELIEGALADGVITDKERAVLHKKAESEGVDPDELDMVLDGRLAKKKSQIPIPPKPVESTKMGNVMKCPNCGEPYQPGAYKCPTCGHVFQNIEANRSSVRLAAGIQRMMDRAKGKELTEKEVAQICSYIKNFPIPTTKDDILEFMLLCRAKAGPSDDISAAFYTKIDETVAKAKIIFPDDPQVQAAVKEVTKFRWYDLGILWLLIGSLILMGIVLILGKFVG